MLQNISDLLLDNYHTTENFLETATMSSRSDELWDVTTMNLQKTSNLILEQTTENFLETTTTMSSYSDGLWEVTTLNLHNTSNFTLDNQTIENFLENATTAFLHPLRAHLATRISFITLFISIFILGTIGNICVMIIVFKTPILRTCENILHINLSIIDLLTCIFVMLPLLVFYTINKEETEIYECTLLRISLWSPAANMVNLAEISLLRCVKIRHPTRNITTKTYIFGLLLPWIIGIILSIYSVTSGQNFSFSSKCVANTTSTGNTTSPIVFITALCTIIITINYVLIYRKITHQKRAIRPYAGSYSIERITTYENVNFDNFSTNPEAVFTCTVQRTGQNLHYAHIVQKNQEVVVTSALIIITFAVTVFPSVLISFVAKALPKSQIVYNINQICTCIFFVNSFTNPYIYAYRNNVFKQQFKRLFTFNFMRKETSQPDNFI